MSENAMPLDQPEADENTPEAPLLPARAETSPFRLTLEGVLYIGLLAVALLLRLVALGDVLPSIGELPDLLAAWRGTTSDSPTLFWIQSLSFDLLGGSILAARLVTALAAMVLALSPALFRAELGRTRALLFTLLLTVSAPLLITARTSSPVVWTALFGVIAVRLWLNQFHVPTAARGIMAVVASAALVLLGDPSSVILAIMLMVGALVAISWGTATTESDVAAESGINRIRAALRAVPWEHATIIAVLVVAALASGFMTAPSALSTIGGLVGGVAGLFTPNSESALGVSLFYQVLVWVFAVAAMFVFRREGWSAPDRFFLGWMAAALAALILLPGLESQHSVLITLPLCGLASGVLARCFTPDKRQSIYAEQQSASGDELAMLYAPPAGRLILSVAVFALLLILSVHLQATARESLLVEDGAFGSMIARLQANTASQDFRVGLLWSFITIMFLLVGFFLAASIWGNRVSLQGFGLGFFAALMLTQLSGGWYAAAPNDNGAVEPWRYEVTDTGYALLERTLDDFSLREAQGFPLLPIVVVRDPSLGVTENGLVAWLLRDYTRVSYVNSTGEASTAPIVIQPEGRVLADTPMPDLGGTYVGQRFTLTRAWDPATMSGLDFLAWYLQRRTRVQPYPYQTVILWVRQDVFDRRPIQDLLR